MSCNLFLTPQKINIKDKNTHIILSINSSKTDISRIIDSKTFQFKITYHYQKKTLQKLYKLERNKGLIIIKFPLDQIKPDGSSGTLTLESFDSKNNILMSATTEHTLTYGENKIFLRLNPSKHYAYQNSKTLLLNKTNHNKNDTFFSSEAIDKNIIYLNLFSINNDFTLTKDKPYIKSIISSSGLDLTPQYLENKAKNNESQINQFIPLPIPLEARGDSLYIEISHTNVSSDDYYSLLISDNNNLVNLVEKYNYMQIKHSRKIPKGTHISLLPTLPNRPLTPFTGWYTQSENPLNRPHLNELLINQDTELFAQWSYPFTYTVNSKENSIVITGIRDDYHPTTLNLPDKINNKPVTAIGPSAFQNQNSLTGPLSIPDSVISIGDNAFNNCSELNGSLTLSNSLTTIGNSAFSNCSNLTGDLIIPDSVSSIGDNAFFFCSALTGILKIPSSVEKIGEWAFYQCESFTSIDLSKSKLTQIESHSFQQLKGAKTIKFPSSLKIIKEEGFIHCINLKSLTLPKSIEEIGNRAFSNTLLDNSSEVTIFFPESLITLGDYIFDASWAIKTINCQANSKPEGWSIKWNKTRASGSDEDIPSTINWGVTPTN